MSTWGVGESSGIASQILRKGDTNGIKAYNPIEERKGKIMKRITHVVICTILSLSLLFAGCASQQPQGEGVETDSNRIDLTAMTAEEIIITLQDAGFPIDNIIVYDESTDPNTLMNKDGQYIQKVAAADTRIEQYDPSDPNGVGIEIFNNNIDAKSRKDYIDSFGEASPLLAEMSFIEGAVLLRISNDLTKTQGDQYGQALSDLANGIMPSYSEE